MGKWSDIPKLAERALKDASSKSQLETLGQEAKALIQKRTRLGGGVESSLGPRTQLKKLSEPYKKQRRKLKRDSKLSDTTTPAKSNLTQTGQMIESIDVNVSNGKVSLFFSNTKAKLKAKWVQDGGRGFFNISKPEFNQLQKNLQERVQSILKKLK